MDIVSALALALCLAFLAGKLAHRIHIPKVTGYVVVGVLLGPSIGNVITSEIYQNVKFVGDLALGLILFNIGGQFHRKLLKEVGLRTIKFTFIIAAIVYIFVAGGCALLAPLVSDLSWFDGMIMGLFLGVVAIATAPPTTLMVIKEYDSKGPVTTHIIVFLAIGTIIAIVGASALSLVFKMTGAWPVENISFIGEALKAIWSVLGAILIGFVLGMGLSYWEQHERQDSELLLGVVCAILLGLMLSAKLGVESLLVSIFLGFALVNSSPSGEKIHASVKGMGMSIYALFFVLAGAHVHLEQLLIVGAIALVYVVARVLGFAVGSRFSAHIIGENKSLGKYTGMGLLSHAGAALGIVSQLEKIDTPSAQAIVDVVYAAVVVFEIVGPVLLRRTLLQSAEVKIASLISDSLVGVNFTIRELVSNFMHNVGLVDEHEAAKNIETIKSLIDRKVLAINASANLEGVVKFIDDHHFPIYPVVNVDNQLEGVISLDEMKDVMFDPFLSRLILAQDLIQTRASILETDTPQEAHDRFVEAAIETLPVVHPETKKYMGALDHKRVLLAMHKEE